jgi:dienelactone hydrolase
MPTRRTLVLVCAMLVVILVAPVPTATGGAAAPGERPLVALGQCAAPAAGRSGTVAQAAEAVSDRASSVPAIELEPVTEAAYGITSVAPVGWERTGAGIRGRRATPGDLTQIALQTAPVGVDQVWASLLRQLGLTEVPEPVGTRDTPAGATWDLYSVTLPGDLVADIALAPFGDGAWLVLLISSADEAATLRDEVLLPAVDAFAIMPEPSAAPGDRPYTETEVSFPGGDADVTLAGTLTVPPGPGPHPAVVLMSGSGPQDRDESLAGMTLKPFALLADALASAGVVVLRYDDRGTAASTGDYDSATLDRFTADGAAALAYLRSRPEVDAARTGILGHSEGGAYVAAIAAEDPDVAFVIGLAPMVRPGLELLIDQNESIARSQGASEEEVERARQFATDLFDAALARDRTLAECIIRVYFGEQYDRQDEATRELLGDREAFIKAQLDAQVQVLFSPWYQSFLRSDPSADWRRVTAPVLGVFGGKDVQVPAEAESAALEAALAAVGGGASTVVTLPEANHLFQRATTGAITEYAILEQTFTPDLLPLVTDWVREVTGLADGATPAAS